jgi:hypothetical protein
LVSHIREENGLKVFENRIIRRIFGPNTRMEKIAQWGLHILLLPKYYYANKIKENEVGGTCGTQGTGEECVQGFDGKARRKETTWKTKA